MAASIAYFFPQYFTHIGDFKLSGLIKPLLVVIMFGMGTTMTTQDFLNVVKMPKAVIIGVFCQFFIMPFLGFTIANTFNFEPEIAAGIILIGCSPSGLASNVMSYIAKANVALSITITSIATLLAPVLTPFLMKMLGGQFIEVNFLEMFLDIIKIVILPVVIGFLINFFLKKQSAWLQKILPLISMAGIALIIVIITANGQAALSKQGLALILATLTHNCCGYLLGYWGGRLFKLSEQDCRTISIEVGLQNAGLASALAVGMKKAGTVGVSAALFGPIMNITGSLMASFWSKRIPKSPTRF